ncbi:MAG TPA: rhodanese-like domain-containing protein [Pyrinomonadaceae bacterium]
MWRKFNHWLALILCAALASLAAACKAGDGAGASRAGAGAASTTTSTTTAGATPHPTSTPNDGVRRVTTDEARALVERGEALIVDVRVKGDYDKGHIKGSICVPRTEIDKRLAELPKDKLLIFYCA